MQQANPRVMAATPSLVPRDGGGAEERVFGEIRRLGLIENAWELDTRGFTVLTPEQLGAAGLAERLTARILDFSEERTGVRPDLDSGASHTHFLSKLGRTQMMKDILYFDPLFEQALMHPKLLALITYLVGESCVLDTMNAHVKAPGPEYLVLHSDTPQPTPLPPYAQVCNATWILSDYELDSGPTVFVPGSHRLCRWPYRDEAENLELGEPLLAKAGSVVIWHGNTWHGALPRTAPGLRISLILFFIRWYMKPQYGHAERVTQEMLDRNDARFATLMGRELIDGARPGYATRGSPFA